MTTQELCVSLLISPCPGMHTGWTGTCSLSGRLSYTCCPMGWEQNLQSSCLESDTSLVPILKFWVRSGIQPIARVTWQALIS